MVFSEKQLVKIQLSRWERLRKQVMTEDLTEVKLQMQAEMLQKQFEEFTSSHEHICAIVEDENPFTSQYFDDDIYGQFERVYFQFRSQILEKLQSIRIPAINTPQNENVIKSNVRIPVLKTPTFSGKYVDFHSFKDQLDAWLSNVTNMQPVQKFQYLLDAVEGPAKDLIKHFPIVNESFELA